MRNKTYQVRSYNNEVRVDTPCIEHAISLLEDLQEGVVYLGDLVTITCHDGATSLEIVHSSKYDPDEYENL